MHQIINSLGTFRFERQKKEGQNELGIQTAHTFTQRKV